MRYIFLILALSFSSSLQAQVCDVGEAGDGGVEPCVPCAMGRYQDQVGQSSCLPCEPGSYQDQIGQISCTLCEAGTFTSNFESIDCSPCPAGMTSAAGASSCTIIPASDGGGGCGAITQASLKSQQRADLLLILTGLFLFLMTLKLHFQKSKVLLDLQKIK